MDFFQYIDEFRKYIQIPASVKLEALDPSFRPAKRKIINLIGKATYTKIKDAYTSESEDETLKEAIEYVQAALANMMHIDYFKLSASERNSTENKMYKYQEDQTIEINISNTWTELDNLLEILEANNTVFPDFENTDAYKVRDKLIFKNAREFDKEYGIDESAYFYMRTVYIQYEVITDVLTKRGVDIESINQDEKYEYAVKKSLAYEVMARACKQFDYLELPKSLRNDMYNEMRKRDFKQSTSIKEEIFQQLHNKAYDYLLDVEDWIQKQNAGTYEVPEDVNSEDNKFFFTT
ncbi:DUF6712 family protein [Plebeiibacterium sediminum]|uniref:Uncharacterized protein n=1 Tax=Plebeiibacterium sediminum TaxID=2992112 RepID=A0AAE3M0T9_9BACT|nr:DUF6712 family protein [Plebeiobacterium sediminum]MCW3784928.1 hypothetical protein [Plebeiobacterium sediminum]